jgi:hypothetical protein
VRISCLRQSRAGVAPRHPEWVLCERGALQGWVWDRSTGGSIRRLWSTYAVGLPSALVFDVLSATQLLVVPSFVSCAPSLLNTVRWTAKPLLPRAPQPLEFDVRCHGFSSTTTQRSCSGSRFKPESGPAASRQRCLNSGSATADPETVPRSATAAHFEPNCEASSLPVLTAVDQRAGERSGEHPHQPAWLNGLPPGPTRLSGAEFSGVGAGWAHRWPRPIGSVERTVSG